MNASTTTFTRPSHSDTNTYDLDFPFSLGAPTRSAGFRTVAEDFQVVEELGFSPEGTGEHLLLNIRKRDENTRWVAKLLAQHFDVAESTVGYCGMKDRRAVTTQWFSVQLPGSGSVVLPELGGCEILASGRHPKKLRPGMHRENAFVIRLRFDDTAMPDIESRLEMIAQHGVPNYFGEQRFGIAGNNLREVAAIVSSPQPRFRGKRGGLYLSAARSWLFNTVLAERVRRGTWRAGAVNDAPMWGRGRPEVAPEVAVEEAEILADWQSWCNVLEHSGLRQERRAMVLAPRNFQWRWHGNDLELSFSLPPGSYATALLRELAQLHTPSAA